MAGFWECGNIFGFHKMRGVSGLIEDLLGSEEDLCSLYS